jgi:hypothetical protein
VLQLLSSVYNTVLKPSNQNWPLRQAVARHAWVLTCLQLQKFTSTVPLAGGAAQLSMTLVATIVTSVAFSKLAGRNTNDLSQHSL